MEPIQPSSDDKLNINDFVLLKVIGKGSYATVMLAKRKDTDEVVALKMLNKRYLRKKKQEAHTKTERLVLEEITHPFIIQLKYAFQNKKKLYLALEYCPGGELFFRLHQEGEFSEATARFYAAQLVLALGHLHEHDVVYRDLKPENVLISQDGYLKLADFGLSKMQVVSETDAKSF